jgi:hypothetical protein
MTSDYSPERLIIQSELRGRRAGPGVKFPAPSRVAVVPINLSHAVLREVLA